MGSPDRLPTDRPAEADITPVPDVIRQATPPVATPPVILQEALAAVAEKSAEAQLLKGPNGVMPTTGGRSPWAGGPGLAGAGLFQD